MAYEEHVVADDKVAYETANYLLLPKLDVLNLVTRWAPERFYGQHGDTITVRVPGALPARTYGWRNDRSEPIKVDKYEETTVTLTVELPEDDYSAVEISDEQRDFDLGGSFGLLLEAQTTTIARKVNNRVRDQITNAPYEICVGVDVTQTAITAAMAKNQDVWFNGFIDAGRELTKMGVPFTNRSAIVGSAVAAELQKSQKLLKVQGNNNDGNFATANIGTYAGFTISEDQLGIVDPDEALVFDSTGFQFWTYAPSIPTGAIRGARSNIGNVAMRWIVDYDPAYLVDRSVWNTLTGLNYSSDFVQGHDTDNNVVRGETPYFVRGVKIRFADGTGGWKPGDGGAATNDRKGASATSELALYYNNQPLSTAVTPAGRFMPLVLGTTEGMIDDAIAAIPAP